MRDLPIHGKPVGIYLIPSVFIASHAVALEHLPVVDDKRQMTDRADAYADLVQTFDNWQPCILNYFQHPVINPYTESLNNLSRVMNRLSEVTTLKRLGQRFCSRKTHKNQAHKKPNFQRRTVERSFEKMAMA